MKSNAGYTMKSSRGPIKPIRTSGTFSIRDKIGRRIAKCTISSPNQPAQNAHTRRKSQRFLAVYPKTNAAVATVTNQSFLKFGSLPLCAKYEP